MGKGSYGLQQFSCYAMNPNQKRKREEFAFLGGPTCLASPGSLNAIPCCIFARFNAGDHMDHTIESVKGANQEK